MKSFVKCALLCGLMSLGGNRFTYAQTRTDSMLLRAIDKEVQKGMRDGEIPGLSLVIIDSGRETIRTYGYSNEKDRIPVTVHTLFQLGSCSKAFTALAIQRLVKEGKIDQEGYVSDYLPWFKPRLKDSPVKITILQVLHHTSGIPWTTISTIPERNDEGALEQTIRNIATVNLRSIPGRKYEYATINYDILALIIQEVTGLSYETYLRKYILEPLQLYQTSVGQPVDSSRLSRGYKIGFFAPREYKAPVYRGNDAAGYVTTDAVDIARWLRFQMGLLPSDLSDLAQLTHQRDESVALHGMYSYAMGWDISLTGNQEISHGGTNPNYTSYLAFRSNKKMGVAVLANSNSGFTSVIATRIMKLIAGEKRGREFDPGDGNDRAYSVISFVVAGYFLVVIGFIYMMVRDIVRRKRRFAGFSLSRVRKVISSLVLLLPFAAGLYLIPQATAGFSWRPFLVWSPVSLICLMLILAASMAISYVAYWTSLLFPEQNEFKRIIPRILLLSILSGISNTLIIIMVTSALDTTVRLRYLVFYFGLAMSVYLLGRWFVQINLIRLSRTLIYDLRIKLTNKIFSTYYQRFEKIDRGRIYTSMNDDVETIGSSVDQFITLITNCFTTAGAFIYLASISFWTTILTIGLIVMISFVYYFVVRNTQKYFEAARDTRDVFMRLVNGLIDGFKEITLHRNKKVEYREDIQQTAAEYKEKLITANSRFVNAFLVGESLLVLLLGVTVYAIPRMFPGIQLYVIMSFIIIILYLIGPINTILGAIPSIMQLRVAWNRIQQFLKDIPATMDLNIPQQPICPRVESIRAEGLKFTYRTKEEQDSFSVGPIDLEVRRGEILFIAGGNGSGKTTFAKLLLGLYVPDEGQILINGEVVDESRLGEHFSAVFNPSFLFEKLYNIEMQGKEEKIEGYLKRLNLDDKVIVTKNRYSTIDLSGGQRKRLALLQCYLEDSPIYLFDEWAADQDPEYRKFFYRTLLPEMSLSGKIVIAITHDDHYFDVADKILFMKEGRSEMHTSFDKKTLNLSII